jgi:Glycosyl hydrolase family 63 C-terminal domain
MLGMGGLRSLGLKDSYYGNGANYWKSPVWINVNFLVLGGLFDVYLNGSMKSKLYETLKQQIQSVYRNGR